MIHDTCGQSPKLEGLQSRHYELRQLPVLPTAQMVTVVTGGGSPQPPRDIDLSTWPYPAYSRAAANWSWFNYPDTTPNPFFSGLYPLAFYKRDVWGSKDYNLDYKFFGPTGLNVFRSPGFTVTTPTPLCGSCNEKCKLYGPTWGTLAEYPTNSFWTSAENVTSVWAPGSPPTELAYDEFDTLLLGMAPRRCVFVRLAEGESLEFECEAIGSLRTYPYADLTVRQFWPGKYVSDFIRFSIPIDTDGTPIDQDDRPIDL
jgi:hypothetical protein